MSRHTLHKAKAGAVRRLAKWMGVEQPKCLCSRCHHKLVDRVANRIFLDEIKDYGRMY